ncbi:MAG: FAD-binding oxidoreductase [Shinella sp.]|nr:MAG: FAD-binding oxidoreductase [Shinella sp.]
MYHPNQDSPNLPKTAFTAPAGSPLGLKPLSGEITVDLVVIGGGVTGCSATLHATESGMSVVQLEANEIGWGASGRNAGHVAPASKLSLEEAYSRYGKIHGARFNDACENGPDLVFDVIRRFGIDAELKTGGIAVAAHSEAAVEEYRHRAAVMRSEGKPAHWLDRADAEALLGSPLYLGAFYDERGGAINPLAYCRGMVRAAMGMGARVFERSRAEGIERVGNQWRVKTAGGAVFARNVIIATNAYTDDLWKGLKRSIVPARSYHFATMPLPQEIAETILPGVAVMTDRRRLLIGLRVTADRRIHFNGYGPVNGVDTGPDIARTTARLEEIYPQLGKVQLDMSMAWHGWMAMSVAGTWKVHRLAEGITAALGCNGRGVAMGSFLGRDLARHANGANEADLTLPFERMTALPLHFLTSPIARFEVMRKDRQDEAEMARLRSHNNQRKAGV